MVDLDALIRDLPDRHLWRPRPDEPLRRRWDELESELAASERIIPPGDAGRDFRWLAEGVVVDDPNPDVPAADQLVTDDAIASEGTDALAWYQPFHADARSWGIYLLDRGVWTLARFFQDHKLSPDRVLDCLRVSVEALFAHEYFHFLTEMAATILEATQVQLPARGLYGPYRDAVRNAPAIAKRPTEEALANALAMRETSAYAGMWAFTLGQPSGYRDWDMWHGDDWPQGLRHLLSQILRPEFAQIPDEHFCAAPSETVFDLARKLAPPAAVPVYLVRTLPDAGHRRLFDTGRPSG